MKKMVAWILVFLIICLNGLHVQAADLGLASPSTVLIEAETGQIVYQQNANERRSPASITKIMTLLLIFEELEKGNLKLEDTVTVSAYAKSMGGSQVFLEEGEQQDVETMIKCIVIASGNDASVAMAEHIAGSETEFVARMNEKADKLGMKDTNFCDCCGLTEAAEHYTTAADVAVMSRELIIKYPQVLTYSSIWMENIVHETKKGSSPFTLSNTNKLIRSYDGCVGLKTGSTSIAKYCVSAVAKRGEVTLIAVVMGAPDYKIRFADAASMLNYGFGICRVYKDENMEIADKVKVKGGVVRETKVMLEKQFQYLDTEGKPIENIERSLKLAGQIQAPVKTDTVVGKAVYKLDGKEIGTVNLMAAENVKKAGFADCLSAVWHAFLL